MLVSAWALLLIMTGTWLGFSTAGLVRRKNNPGDYDAELRADGA